MELKLALLLVTLLGLSSYGEGKLYGLHFIAGGHDTQTILEVVEIDVAKGTFTPIAQTLVSVGSSATIDGVSTFDQKNEYFYFSTDIGSSFVFGVDVINRELLPPISIGASAIRSISWDRTNNQLLIFGAYADESLLLISFPDDGPSQKLINLTDYGVKEVYTTAIDSSKGIFYFAYYNQSADVFKIGSFPLATPSKVQTSDYNCDVQPDRLFYDPKKDKLFGVGYVLPSRTFSYFELTGSQCIQVSLGQPGIVLAASYDPTIATLYMSFLFANAPPALLLFNINTNNVTQLATDDLLVDIQVSY